MFLLPRNQGLLAQPVRRDHQVSQVLADLVQLVLVGLGGLLVWEVLVYLDQSDLPARRDRRWLDRKVRRGRASSVPLDQMDKTGWTVDRVLLDPEGDVVHLASQSWAPPVPPDPPVQRARRDLPVRRGRPARSPPNSPAPQDSPPTTSPSTHQVVK